MRYYNCKYNKVGEKNQNKVRYIEFDMRNDELKQAYGFVLDDDLKILGRTCVNGTDDEYNKLCDFMDRGVNMFTAGNGIVVIQ